PSDCMRSAEIKIVTHEIKTSFRPDEEILGCIESQAGAYVAQQMVCADKIRAACEAAIGYAVKSDALCAQAAHQFQCRPVAQLRSKDCVDVVKDRTEVLKALVEVLRGPPRHFALDADALTGDETRAHHRERTRADGLRRKVAARVRGRRRSYAADADGRGDLL